MKARIIEQLGQVEMLLPSRIVGGLAANDRAKVRLSALQAIAARGGNPTAPADDLSAECRVAGIDASEIKGVMAAAHMSAPGTVAAPGLAKIIKAVFADTALMVDAVAMGDAAVGSVAANRLSALKADFPLELDEIELRRIAALISLPAAGEADSIHRLVMDLHKALNRLAAGCAKENIAGALAYGLKPDDRPIVEAFMIGLECTRVLKFDHPGLGTTVTRSGSRLVIQNDIGTTDAHVLVVTVEALNVAVTYTDVHHGRAKFFVGLLERFAVAWSGLDREAAKGLGDHGAFYLITGRFEADSGDIRDAFLKAIGMSLVFLIDWNKARKSLRTLVDDEGARRVLDWAARHRIGHRAYLECGGADLVAAAVRHAAPARIGFGEQLAAVLGRDIAVDFLKAVLRIAMEGLRDGRSSRLVRDMVETELVRHLDRTDSATLSMVVRQLGLAHDVAAAIASHIADRPVSGRGRPVAAWARRIEEKADRIAVDARSAVRRFNASSTIAQLVNAAEDAVDELEQAAFLASLAPAAIAPALLGELTTLANAAIGGAEAAASGIDAASEVSQGQRIDVDDAFNATRRLIDLEHVADDAERAVTGLVLRDREGTDVLCILELARALERATDRFARIGHLLHEHVMADLSA
jgi:uncharacterized protein Yka (UPF0111/DUF47 family)